MVGGSLGVSDGTETIHPSFMIAPFTTVAIGKLENALTMELTFDGSSGGGRRSRGGGGKGFELLRLGEAVRLLLLLLLLSLLLLLLLLLLL